MASVPQILVWVDQALSNTSQASLNLLETKIQIEQAQTAVNSIRSTSVDLGDASLALMYLSQEVDDAFGYIAKINESLDIYKASIL